MAGAIETNFCFFVWKGVDLEAQDVCKEHTGDTLGSGRSGGGVVESVSFEITEKQARKNMGGLTWKTYFREWGRLGGDVGE
jgi:hypothetical protein